jgi:hypothetical protein
MSSVVIAGNTSGTITLDAPNVAGTTVLTLPTANGTVLTSANINSNLPAGSVLQVVQAVKTNTFSTTSASGTFADITGLSVSITPSNANNKILILAEVRAATPSSNGSFIRAMRDSTAIYIGDAGGGSRIRVSSQGYNPDGNSNTNQTIMFLDSPATTSSTTYKIQACVGGTSGTVYVNRSDNNSDNVFTGMPASSITVMEIKG